MRCGPSYKLPNGQSAPCNPDDKAGLFCCSPAGWCGNSSDHCDCRGCVNYSFKNQQDKEERAAADIVEMIRNMKLDQGEVYVGDIPTGAKIFDYSNVGDSDRTSLKSKKYTVQSSIQRKTMRKKRKGSK